MIRRRIAFNVAIICLFIIYSAFPLGATTPIIENGDFEKGDLSGWTVFTTMNGTLGGPGFPDCVDFDTTGDGVATKSLVVKVGQREFKHDGTPLAGGGIWTTVWLEEGQAILTADIASAYSSPTDRRNLAGGMFEILLDGNIIAHYDMGPIENGSITRFTLNGQSFVSHGKHEVRIRIRRPFRSAPHDQAPRQYIDNVQVHVRVP